MVTLKIVFRRAITFSLLLLLISFANTISAIATDVEGIITENTTWDLSGSPYIIRDRVQVANGVTLTIEPGVIVQDGAIEVFGALKAIGTEEKRITFENVKILPGSTVDSSLIHLEFCTLNGGELFPPTGYAAHGSLILRDSVLNEVGNNYSSPIYLWYPSSNCYIERNVFNHSTGISIGTDGDISVFIRNNVFYQWTTDYAVQNWASYDSSKTVVEFNSFLTTDKIAVMLPAGYNNAAMNATNNYWGTTDPEIISSMIFDKNDDLGCSDYIEYEPFLIEPHPDTPSLNIGVTNSTTNSTTNSSETFLISCLQGWNLKGTSYPIDISIFNNPKIVSVWKWSENGWQFWSPDTSLMEIAQFYGIDLITKINAGDGFWIKASAPVEVPIELQLQ
jgi:hypothetical protein